MMTINDYATVIESILESDIKEAEKEPVYKENRYSIEEYTDGLNEGYVSGLKAALNTIKRSYFLVSKGNDPRRLLKPCPFCGSQPILRKSPLWHGSHGYYGCYNFEVICEKCGCNPSFYYQNDTIYRSEDEAKRNVIDKWNRRVE